MFHFSILLVVYDFSERKAFTFLNNITLQNLLYSYPAYFVRKASHDTASSFVLYIYTISTL